MKKNKYEIHRNMDPLLPFIFHADKVPTPRMMSNWHESLEIVYCVQGSGSVKYNEGSCSITPGDMVVINTDVLHDVVNESNLVFRSIIIDRTFCVSNGIPVSELYFQEKIRDSALAEALADAFAAYAAHKNRQTVCSAAEVRAKVLTFLCLLCRNYICFSREPVKFNKAEEVEQVLRYIKQNYSKALTLEEIAGVAGISKSYLAREFKKYTGKTVFDMVMEIRCKEARQMISAGETASRAAAVCGFESLSYFSKVFKRYYGMPPSQYAKNKRGNSSSNR